MSDNFSTGNKVISYALNCLAWGVTCAVAWSCSTLLMGIIMFIIMSIVMTLLTTMLNIFFVLKLDAPTIEGIGHTVGGATRRITSLFTRQAV